MKFYFEGKLVRTSKTHEYHYGVYNKFYQKMRSCHSTKELAEKELQSYINEPLSEIENCKLGIKALKSGKKGYWVKCGRRSFPVRFEKEDTVEQFEESIKSLMERHEYRKKNFCVVELEARN